MAKQRHRAVIGTKQHDSQENTGRTESKQSAESRALLGAHSAPDANQNGATEMKEFQQKLLTEIKDFFGEAVGNDMEEDEWVQVHGKEELKPPMIKKMAEFYLEEFLMELKDKELLQVRRWAKGDMKAQTND
jgi:uncharacterized membrane protein YheB (UPF0754 family)